MAHATYRPDVPDHVVVDTGVDADALPFDQVPAYVERLLIALDRLQVARRDDWRDQSIAIPLGRDTVEIFAIEALPLAIAILNAARVPGTAHAITGKIPT
jgi:hypothetical protein